jgi:diguanylate cyclase (GGDEF)-like protein
MTTPSTGDERGHDQPESRRDVSARERDDAAGARDAAGDHRDEVADARDRAADLRDLEADRRDDAAEGRDEAGGRRDRDADERDRSAQQGESAVRPPLGEDALGRLRRGRLTAATDRRDSADDRLLSARDRRRSAADRRSAGLDRSMAAGDREVGRFERGNAEADRAAAAVDRDVAATDREAAHLDELTGAYRRGSGFRELERELLRAGRDGRPLAVAFVDVDHLKHVNDSHGHAAGDRLLQHVAAALRAKLRAYDMVIRYGGDEFVAVMSGLTAEGAAARLGSINAVLHSMSSGASMSVGVSELQPGDSPDDLVRRADEALYRGRSARA